MKRLPLLPTWLLKQLDCSASKDAVLGDLAERFQKGESVAWYCRQSFFAIVAGAFHDLRSRKLLALRALFGAFLVGVCMEVFVSRYLVYAGNWVPGEWWNSERFVHFFEFFVSMTIALIQGILGGWTVVRLYRRGRAVLLLYIAVVLVFILSVVARSGASLYPPGSIIAGIIFVVSVLAGGLSVARCDHIEALHKRDTH